MIDEYGGELQRLLAPLHPGGLSLVPFDVGKACVADAGYDATRPTARVREELAEQRRHGV